MPCFALMNGTTQTPELTEEQRLEISSAFAMFDQNGDGQVDREELIEVMRAMGQNPTVAEATAMIAEVDVNQNGKVEYREFEQMMAKRGVNSIMQEEDDLREAFKVFDRNGDGFITIDELRVTMTNMGEPLTKEELEDMISSADTNHDGKVHYDEFVKMMVN
ncbi:calmodulin [Elysia marginata]|uniref:Calmodulin n=1 Tax=Elysia marginata TaxID=1093978 RepID=A0AAV4HBM7_9GAST|nr:calmodulin [Elysia marginata]